MTTEETQNHRANAEGSTRGNPRRDLPLFRACLAKVHPPSSGLLFRQRRGRINDGALTVFFARLLLAPSGEARLLPARRRMARGADAKQYPRAIGCFDADGGG